MKILLGKKIKYEPPWDQRVHCACGLGTYAAVYLDDARGEIAEAAQGSAITKSVTMIIYICPACGIAITRWKEKK